jgi:hypothetical protein
MTEVGTSGRAGPRELWLAETLSKAWGECWAFFEQDSQASAQVRAEARGRAVRLLTAVSEVAWVEAATPLQGRLMGTIRRIANGYVLMSRVWPPEDVAELPTPHHGVLSWWAIEWGVAAWCAEHGFPLDPVTPVRRAEKDERADRAVRGEPKPHDWESIMAEAFLGSWDAYEKAAEGFSDPYYCGLLFDRRDGLREEACAMVCAYTKWQRFLEYHGLHRDDGQAVWAATETGTILGDIYFLLGSAESIAEVERVCVPDMASMRSELEVAAVLEWAETHASSR